MPMASFSVLENFYFILFYFIFFIYPLFSIVRPNIKCLD